MERVMVGDRVLISRPKSLNGIGNRLGNRFGKLLGDRIGRPSTVTAVRPQSFDAGGLCFRHDGREWNGHNRVQFIARAEGETDSLKVA